MESRWVALSLGHQGIPEIPWVKVLRGPWTVASPFPEQRGTRWGSSGVGSHLRNKWGDNGATPGTCWCVASRRGSSVASGP